MKVSILSHDLSGSGAARWAASRPFLLYQALQQLGYEVEILGFNFGDRPPNPAVRDRFPLTLIPGQPLPQFWQSARTLSRAISGDIVYALRPYLTTLGLALWHRWRTRTPVVLDVDDWVLGWCGGDDLRYPTSLKQVARDILKPNGALRHLDHPLYLRWAEKLVPRADAVTIHSQFLQDRFGGAYVPNGKDVDLFDPARCDRTASRDRYGLSDYRVLMFPGAPRPYKGIEDVLLALDHLDQPDLRLVIVGGSPYDDYDRHLHHRWARWLIQLPIQPAHTMPDLVAAADIIVVPQRDTPITRAQFPLKLTDGMAMAKPIIASRVGDIPTLLGDTGFLVEPESPAAIAAQIQWIFTHYDRALALGQQARNRCIAQYSFAAMAARLAEVLTPLTPNR
ncbi:glycosyltransferase family 4 protein [Spirulina major CS-329]|uniref:glycosyltransferase family 4 protein n=1 Tax=Spirulina TaxID=1154 RepID=UPI00232B7AB0|nr:MULTISPECIES: glycosyltransferase family 4 protein [Spirulina]MDB9495060.1 glycosyltransferase family 4 protein [Spirulina subsalsa CS-330]MDB9504222.1 glycosyltransferase family 4 protein [Spirulina major CS-329]